MSTARANATASSRPVERASEPTPHDQHHTDESDGAKAHQCGQHVMPRQAEDATRETLPRRPVRGPGMTPERIHQVEDPPGSEDAGPVDVGIETPADHFALRHVAVHIPAEQGGHDQDGQGPGDSDGGHGPSGVPGCRRSVRTISNHDPTISATPVYTSMRPKNVPFFDPDEAPMPKNHAPGAFNTNGEPACATPIKTQTAPTNPTTPDRVSE